MNLFDFSIARLPRIIFSRGAVQQVPQLIAQYGNRALLVFGARSFENSPAFDVLKQQLTQSSIEWFSCNVPTEPSPQLVDEQVSLFTDKNIDVVVGIGGGSALDAAKAIAGLLRVGRSVMDYLEGVGPELPYEGPAVPLIAVPTTAGTGSEATKNAVLSVQGASGFKKSFRDDKLVAEYAILDPGLLATCPKTVVAANGMDALTQLIESYVSTNSNIMTDALAISGLRAARDGLLAMYENPADQQAQEKMAYASLMSGICLAQTGLGSVHGLASPLGAFYPIPHGVVCGTLVAVATEINIRCMQQREPQNPSLDKYATLGDVLNERRHASKDASREALCELLQQWTERMELARLSDYGVSESGFGNIIKNCRGSSMKTNPIVLTDDEVRELLERRL